MDKSKKYQTQFNRKIQTKLCLNCGFPNRESDKKCMYCKTSIIEETDLISWLQQTFYILRWRRELKQNHTGVANETTRSLVFLKFLVFLIVGVVLSGSGFYFFQRAVTESSFSTALIAFLLIFYGVLTLKSSFTRMN